MNIFKIPSLSRLPYLILHYGIYASIVHATAVLLYARLSPPLPPLTSFFTYFPMIEYSLVAFICVLCGALLCLYVAKKE